MSGLKKILLVDDDDDLREALSEQLVMTEEFDVFEASDGHQGLKRAKEASYDLVILDVGLPDTDGRGTQLALASSHLRLAKQPHLGAALWVSSSPSSSASSSVPSPSW